ncbi:E3 ubiquitin-protein ligase TRAIP [Ostrinia furnacalis]|uniref:E3 ubiquitin-protein ligase TRAIP n=1 Tax=Ostrinia furnacalis TaxID=93504 RepID=UPI00103A8E8C|nr:E3 ubiquitin-protein ligase TRAIP [Ostrinia furnacalis]
MHILCTICSDLVNQAENIFATKCGHIFHYHCLAQWIERSKSCPQCRHKVTDKCMFRIYPTISNESSGEDVTTLQSRLDDAQLQLRQQKASAKDKEDKLAAITTELKKNEELLKNLEKKLVTRESAISALKEQLDYVKIQNKETNRLKEENERLNKNMQTLNGLQKVLNATSDEVEQMLQGYTDVRTVATFATALKRALCESESKKNETRDRLQAAKQQIGVEKNNVADLQAKLLQLEEKLTHANRKNELLLNKRKISDVANSERDATPSPKQHKASPRLNEAIIIHDNNVSFDTMVNRIEQADSPYLSLKQSSLALSALQTRPSQMPPATKLKPSEMALLNAARNITKRGAENQPSNSQRLSIFHKKEPAKIDFSDEPDMNQAQLDISYDGLGGHSKLDTFPVPNIRPPIKGCVPKLTAKHKLKRPNPPAGSQDISKLLEKIRDK